MGWKFKSISIPKVKFDENKHNRFIKQAQERNEEHKKKSKKLYGIDP